MKKVILYSLITVLYLLTPVCVMEILGTSVSRKYEVDEGYWLIEENKQLTAEQRNFQNQQLDKEGKVLDNRIKLFCITGLTSFVLATTIFVKRKTLMTSKKSGT